MAEGGWRPSLGATFLSGDSWQFFGLPRATPWIILGAIALLVVWLVMRK